MLTKPKPHFGLALKPWRPRLAAGLACIVTALALGACGGGGRQSAAATSTLVSGKVIDGYISGATVFWDCNANQKLDSGEISVKSTAGGNYEISKPNSAACTLTALVEPGAVDEDAPTLPIITSYTMVAVAGQTDLITPYTTLVAGRMRSDTGLSVQQAESTVARDLGFDVAQKILIDYIAPGLGGVANNPALKPAAAVIVTLLQQNQGGRSFVDAIDKTKKDLQPMLAQPGFKETLALGVKPFVDTYQSAGQRLSSIFQSNPNNRLVRSVTFEDASVNAKLDGIVQSVNARQAVGFGAINWNAFSDAELEVILSQLNHLENLKSDSPSAQRINQLRAQRNADFQKISEDYGFVGRTAWDFLTSFSVWGEFGSYISADPVALTKWGGIWLGTQLMESVMLLG